MDINSELLNAILDSIGEGLFTVDKNFRITTFNRVAEDITGFNHKEVQGKFCKYIFQSSRCSSGCPLALTLEYGDNLYDYDMYIKDRHGRDISVQVNTSVLFDPNGKPMGGVVSFRQRAERSEGNSELESLINFNGMVGMDRKMKEIFTLIEEISDSEASVLIQGESGTGKEMIADAIHRTSSRAGQPFVKVNCSVFPETLLASELFGHTKGAFTDARSDRIGRFEAANRGTIFLDEIGEASLSVQLQLLRVLQDGSFERVGESTPRKTDVRIIAATNLDIQKAIRDGRLREDLYYRLNVIPILLPPLRERRMDIPLLVQFFLAKYQRKTNKNITEIDDRVMNLLVNYHWPGNVRELENLIAYLFARCKGPVIVADKLPPHILDSFIPPPAQTGTPHTADEYLKIKHVLEQTHWNKTLAAQKLGLGRTTLWRKMKTYGL